MHDTYETWFHDGAEAYSYRQMYEIASDIAVTPMVPRDLRRIAGRVVRLLEPVIDQPIAPAKLLARARQEFVRLNHEMAFYDPLPVKAAASIGRV
jgi:hypothetical protein